MWKKEEGESKLGRERKKMREERNEKEKERERERKREYYNKILYFVDHSLLDVYLK